MAEFACPYCQQQFTAPTNASTAQVHCPHCGRVVELPKATPERWFVGRNKKKYGPYSWGQLLTLARRGDLKPEDLLLSEGTKQWIRAETKPALFKHALKKGEVETVKIAEPATPIKKRVEAPDFAKQPAPRSKRGLILGILAASICGFLTVALCGAFLLFRLEPTTDPRPANKDLASPDGAISKTDKDALAKNDDRTTKPVDGVNPDRKVDDKKPPDEKPKTKVPNEWIDPFITRLNRRRNSAGLASVTIDDELSNACAAHARYLAKHVDVRKPNVESWNDEDPTKAGYTEDGQRAAQVANIAFAEPLVALDRWFARLFSRVTLLNPDTRSIGLGIEQNAQGDWICVLDMMRGRGDPIVVYPAAKQQDVPISFAGGIEVPDKLAAGFPISITFPVAMTAKDAQLELRDDKGKRFDGWRFTPESPLKQGDQRNSIALIPKGLLASNTLYHAKASAQLNGKPWSLAWSFTTEDDSDRTGVWAKQVLARVNAYRKFAGLKPVTIDEKLSVGCLAHARYLVINEGHAQLQGLKAHDEFPELPGYSDEGRKAGKASDIGIGDYEPIDAVDSWMATLYHRVPILEPHLQTIGFGCARGRRQGWVTVLNVTHGRTSSDRPSPILFPAPDQVDVPLSFPNGGEEPNPIPDDKDGRAGYPITAFFPIKEPLLGASATLTNAKGSKVRCWLSTPEKLANPSFKNHQGNTVCLIPEDPLAANTTYHVHLQGKQAGEPWEKKWKFTTGDGGPSIADATRRVLERYNEYRVHAGLQAVTLDEKLTQGCQAHADYLVRNADVMQKKQASVNDEDPLLPGFTAEGLNAANASLVFTNAPTPVMQIDDLMATFANRVYLLDPQIRRIGFGCAHDIGRGWRCVLDINRGRGGAPTIVYPAPKQADVPLAGLDRIPDAKDAAGFAISVIFPRQAKLRNAQAILVDADNKNVDVWISSPQAPLSDKLQRNTIGVHPLQPLQAGHTYSVTLSVIVDGAEWRQNWSFTTVK